MHSMGLCQLSDPIWDDEDVGLAGWVGWMNDGVEATVFLDDD